jgi:hypothetical protein
LQGPLKIIQEIVLREVYAFSISSPSGIALAPTFISVEASEMDEIVSYEVITQYSGKLLYEYTGNKEEAIFIARSVLKSYKTLNDLKIINGAISVYSLIVTDRMIVKFFDWSLTCRYSEASTFPIKQLLLLDNDFYPPEFRYVSRCANIFSVLKFEYFILGSTILKLFSDFSWQNIEWIDSKCNESDTEFFILERIEEYFQAVMPDNEKLEHAIREWEKMVSRLIISVCNIPEFAKTLCILINFAPDSRYLYANFCNEEVSTEKYFEIYEPNSIKAKSKSMLKELISILNTAINKNSFARYDQYQSTHRRFLQLCESNETFIEHILELEANEPIKSQTIMDLEIGTLFIRMLHRFKDYDKFRLLCTDLESSECNLKQNFELYMTLKDEPNKDRISSILYFPLKKKIIEFLFPIPPKEPDLNVFPIKDYPHIITFFENFLQCTFTNAIYALHNIKNVDLLEAFQNMVDDIYLSSIPSGYSGFTTWNRRIFIKDYYRHLSEKLRISYDQCTSSPLETACIIAILIREFAHNLRRENIRLRREYNERKTPPGPEIRRSSKGKIKERGEAGNDIDIIIFGSHLINMNIHAAEVLLSIGTFETIEKFRIEFMYANSLEGESLNL